MNVDLLKSLPIFHGLAEEELDVMADGLASNHYESGAKVFEIGDKSGALYLIERGFIRLQMAGNHSLATLGPGSLIGGRDAFPWDSAGDQCRCGI